MEVSTRRTHWLQEYTSWTPSWWWPLSRRMNNPVPTDLTNVLPGVLSGDGLYIEDSLTSRTYFLESFLVTDFIWSGITLYSLTFTDLAYVLPWVLSVNELYIEDSLTSRTYFLDSFLVTDFILKRNNPVLTDLAYVLPGVLSGDGLDVEDGRSLAHGQSKSLVFPYLIKCYTNELRFCTC